jgi:hypothetical protein
LKRQSHLGHEFVEFIPAELAEGILYISIPYATAAHLCACGCGRKVVTPFTATDWRLIYDGDSVSLRPSVGNWSFPCRSHYVISKNRIRWAEDWSKEKIEKNRSCDRRAKSRRFNELEPPGPLDDAPAQSVEGSSDGQRKSWFGRFMARLRR